VAAVIFGAIVSEAPDSETTQAQTEEQPATTPLRARWTALVSMSLIVLIAGGVFGYVLWQRHTDNASTGPLAAFVPSESNQDPSTHIPGVVVKAVGSDHIQPGERVAYTNSPPLGGAHDPYWAACTGVVYDRPVRSENLVHSMEHGAAWIAYNPEHVTGDALAALDRRVRGQPYTVMSPYPGLDQPISLQTWGHQLKLSDANDPRIDQFLTALRRNPYTHPELGASCQALGPGAFDQDQPPPFQPAPPVSAIGQPGIRSEGAPTSNKSEPHGGA
jgi:hypothetical protein